MAQHERMKLDEIRFQAQNLFKYAVAAEAHDLNGAHSYANHYIAMVEEYVSQLNKTLAELKHGPVAASTQLDAAE